MSFHSVHSDRIWEDLYAVYAPDFVTMNREYIRKFGVPSSGYEPVDRMMATNLSYVKIPIIKILEYYENGMEVQIPSRDDMIAIHKHIENYLSEWRDHIRYDINLNKHQHKALLLSLERLSRRIFEKAHPSEVMDKPLTAELFGLANTIKTDQSQELVKPEYNSISELFRSPTAARGRF